MLGHKYNVALRLVGHFIYLHKLKNGAFYAPKTKIKKEVYESIKDDD